LLVLSRVELGQQKLHPATHDVNRLLEENVDSMLPLAKAKQIRLQFDPAPMGTRVYADAEAVHQIVTNLLENAIKYTPDGGQVTVGARQISGNLVEVFVRDTGI